MKVPFNFPSFQGAEVSCIMQSIANHHISGDGPFSKKCHEFFENALGVKKSLLTTSCTDALEMSALLMRLQEGDEVIIPSFTFVSTANAFTVHRARPVFVDIRPDTLNIDEKLIEAKINSRTKAIIVVHYAGVSCEMNAILQVAQKYNIPVIEDNAHGLFAKYRGNYLGTLGALATQSFHETKNFTCGEGGALFINDQSFIERAEIIREKGTNRSRFFRGQVDKYSWVDVGSSYLPSDILAAILYAQLEDNKNIQNKRKYIWNNYYHALQEWAHINNISVPFVPVECEQSYHMFYLLMPSLAVRTDFIKFLRANDIYAVFHYLPLHLSDMGKKFGGQIGDCPVTEQISDQLVRLPFFNSMTEEQLHFVIDTILSYKVVSDK